MTRQQIALLVLKGESAQGMIDHFWGFKTICTTAVLSFYGISKRDYKFCQCVDDMIRHLNRAGFSAKATHRKKGIKGKAINSLPKLVPSGYYLVQTVGHVCLAYVSDKKELSFPVETNQTKSKFNLRKIITLHRITLKKETTLKKKTK